MQSSYSSILNRLWIGWEEDLMNSFQSCAYKTKQRCTVRSERLQILGFHHTQHSWSRLINNSLTWGIKWYTFCFWCRAGRSSFAKKWSSRRSEEEKCLVHRGSNTILNWAHRSVYKHTNDKIDHTIYSVIEEWNSAKMACIY